MSDPRKEPDVIPESRPDKPTTQLAAVPAWAAEMSRAMKDGFAMTNANIELVSTDLSVVKDRLVIVESWKADIDTRASRTSARVKMASENDLSHDAQLAQERMARESLAKKVDSLTVTQETQLAILSRLDKVASNPMVKTIMTILGTALATWAASKGLK